MNAGLWEIVPYTSFGPLVLGMTRQETRSIIGDPDASLARSSLDESPSDFYDELGFRLDFDAGDRLQFVEAYSPCDPVYQGVHLLQPDLQKTLAELRQRGHGPGEESGVGPRLYDIGLALYAPDPPRVEAVALFRRGYYDEPLPHAETITPT